VLSARAGFPLWVSGVEPSSVHGITAARMHALPELYRAVAAGLAHAGYDGGSTAIHIPAKQRRCHPPLGINVRARDMLLRSARCRGERGFALLNGRWRSLKRITASPGMTGDITRATLVLTHLEHGHLK
jgi:hypothetical protein